MKKKIVIALLLMVTAVLSAQQSFFDNYVYQNWNSFGGLTGTTTTDIYQTSDGYINIGTYEGLVRFDGVEFKTINKQHNKNYTFSSVRVVLEDSKGNIWIGSNDEGLQRISQNGNKTYTMDNGLPNNSVRAIVEDKIGNIWIGTAAGIVYLTPSGHMITPQFEAGTVSKGIIATTLYCDTAGRVWLVTANDRGLFMYSGGLFRNRPELERYGNYFVSAIAQDLKGDFWVGLGEDGILKIRGDSVEIQKTGTILDSVSTCSIYVLKDGSLLFGTDKGLVAYNNGAYTHYAKSGIGEVKINKIISDREGNVWIATEHSGIGKFKHGKFKMTKLLTEKQTPIASNAIAEDHEGIVWIGTNEGVYCYQGDKEISSPLCTYTKGIRIRHIAVTQDDQILVSCYSKRGQVLFNKKTGRIKSWTVDKGLAGNKVRVAMENAPGEYYVGTTTGLSIIHSDGTIKNLKQLDGLENEYIMCIHKDNNDVVWIGTDGGGIYLMRNEVIIANISSEDGLSGNVIFKITQDKEKVYWICTGGGVSRCYSFDSAHVKPNSFETINMDNGIGTNSVFQLIPDDQDNIWYTSNYGIAVVKSNDLIESAQTGRPVTTVQFYSRDDGLDSDGTTSTALSIRDRHGRLWFTMVDGFAIYDPSKYRENPVLPLVHIESVKVDNVEIEPTENEIKLKPGTKRVDIKYTGISFDAPERIQFTHRLTNFEDDYSEPNLGRVVSYTNLSPGKHTFLVNAINGDGLKSVQAEQMLFVQKPYYYQIPAFWIILVILIFALLILVFYLKQRQIKRENARLEKMVNERTKELAHEKDKSDSLLRSILPDKIADELRDDIHVIADNFSDASILFSDIVEFTKTSSGHTADEIVNALNDLFSRFDERAKQMGVEKIKTIGDAYMAACGIPSPCENHAKIMIDFAKGMYQDLEEYNKTANIKFVIRIGVNCGPVNAGVIGKTKFIYDVWGDTVNVASRMETACSPSKIRVTEEIKQHLQNTDIKFSDPIECNIKGKGLMTTYDIEY